MALTHFFPMSPFDPKVFSGVFNGVDQKGTLGTNGLKWIGAIFFYKNTWQEFWEGKRNHLSQHISVQSQR